MFATYGIQVVNDWQVPPLPTDPVLLESYEANQYYPGLGQSRSLADLEHDRYHNQINANPDSLRFSVYGFVRDDRPKDWLDAAGYLAMYIGLKKSLAGVCDECSCKQHLERKMISLYDLRDTLKSSLMVFKGRRESLIDASPLLKRKTVILVTESNLKYYLHRVKYVDGFTRASD